jgi:hypothetical protein
MQETEQLEEVKQQILVPPDPAIDWDALTKKK